MLRARLQGTVRSLARVKLRKKDNTQAVAKVVSVLTPTPGPGAKKVVMVEKEDIDPGLAREADLRLQPLSSPSPRDRTVLGRAFASCNVRPVLPVARHFRKHVAHDLRAGHEAMLFAF